MYTTVYGWMRVRYYIFTPDDKGYIGMYLRVGKSKWKKIVVLYLPSLWKYEAVPTAREMMSATPSWNPGLAPALNQACS